MSQINLNILTPEEEKLEKWKYIEEFPEYQISDYGRVKGMNGTLLTLSIENNNVTFTISKPKIAVKRLRSYVFQTFNFKKDKKDE
jgi:hypothetical protein